MANQVNFQLSELQLRSDASQGLNYSCSIYSRVAQSSKRSGVSSNEKQRRFSRKKSKESVEKFRNKVKSIEKANSSMCSTNKQYPKTSRYPKAAQPDPIVTHPQKSPIKKNFNNIYNTEHRRKQTALKNLFKQTPTSPHPAPPAQKQNKFSKSQQKPKTYTSERSNDKSGWNIKYLPMSDVLNNGAQPITNKKLIERRLLNKIQINMSYF